MKKVIGFLVISCFCLSMVVFAESDLSSVGKKLKSLGKKSQGGIAGLSERELEALVDEIIEIALEETWGDNKDNPDFEKAVEKNKEEMKAGIKKIFDEYPEILEQAKDESGEITADRVVEAMKNKPIPETDFQIETRADIEKIAQAYLEEAKKRPDFPEDTTDEEIEEGMIDLKNYLVDNLWIVRQARESGELDVDKAVEFLFEQTESTKIDTNISTAKSDILMMEFSVLLYELDNGFFPTTSQGLQALIEKPSSSPRPIVWSGPYLAKLPIDPWENPYHYVHPGIHNEDRFDISSYGPDEVESDDDIANWD